MENYYELLGLSPDASPEQIKQRCLEMGEELRPDIHGESDATQQRFDQIERAFVTLTNSESRAQYDALLQEADDSELEPQQVQSNTQPSMARPDAPSSMTKTLLLVIGTISILFAIGTWSNSRERSDVATSTLPATNSQTPTTQPPESVKQKTEAERDIEAAIRRKAAAEGRKVSASDAEYLRKAAESMIENDKNRFRH